MTGERTTPNILGPPSLEPSIVVINPAGGTDATLPRLASKEDWITHQQLITRLYGAMTLKAHATHERRAWLYCNVSQTALIPCLILTRSRPKMYKSRITLWGLDKNNKEREMRAIVRKYKRRAEQRKASTCQVRGKAVDYQEIVRYFARKRISIEDIMARRATSPTPEAVVCFTPVP